MTDDFIKKLEEKGATFYFILIWMDVSSLLLFMLAQEWIDKMWKKLTGKSDVGLDTKCNMLYTSYLSHGWSRALSFVTNPSSAHTTTMNGIKTATVDRSLPSDRDSRTYNDPSCPQVNLVYPQILYPRLKVHGHASHTLQCTFLRFVTCHPSRLRHNSTTTTR
jgi:hypothetical protein